MKSIKKELSRPLWSTLLLILLVLCAGFPLLAQTEGDILDFYWKQTGEKFASVDPGRVGKRYRLSTYSLYKTISRGGQEATTDSAAIDFYFTGAVLDSQVVRRGSNRHFSSVTVAVPNIFAYPYKLSSFPNDNGRGPLAIGMDTDSADIAQPTGLLLIDRESYEMTTLFLYYDEYREYDRFTLSFGFGRRENYIIPDTAWIVAARPGVLSPEHFRIETSVTGFEVYE
jgi:hypothetical protein